MLAFLEEIRALLDGYPGVVALGEISSDDSTATVAEYTQPGRLHMAYSFELLSNDSSPRHIRETVEKLRQRAPQSWPCWTISNHDVERVVSRWGWSNSPSHAATQLSALVCALRGPVCGFQGEELGPGEADGEHLGDGPGGPPDVARGPGVLGDHPDREGVLPAPHVDQQPVAWAHHRDGVGPGGVGRVGQEPLAGDLEHAALGHDHRHPCTDRRRSGPAV
jgi:glycosidase